MDLCWERECYDTTYTEANEIVFAELMVGQDAWLLERDHVKLTTLSISELSMRIRIITSPIITYYCD